MSSLIYTKALYKKEQRVCRAAVRWAEMMENRIKVFRWSPAERKLYEAVSALLRRGK